MMRRLAIWLLRRTLGPSRADAVLGDLEEELARQSRAFPLAAGLRLAWRAAAFAAGVRSAERHSTWRARYVGAFADLRDAARSLRRSPGFAFTAVVTAALGFALSLATFSVLDGLLLRPLPFPDAERLVMIHRRPVTAGASRPFLVLDRALFTEYQHRAQTITDPAFVRAPPPRRPSPTGNDPPFAVASVTYNLLETLGLRPMLGRDLARSDVRATPQAILLTHEVWMARFSGDPGIPGTRMGDAATGEVEIVGVLPAGFMLPTSQLVERFDGIAVAPDTLEEPPDWGGTVAAPVARLAPGVTLADARAELEALQQPVMRRFPQLFPDDWQAGIVQVDPLQDGITRLYRPYLLFIGVGMVAILALGCLNMSTLLVARAQMRQREMAVRAALGASRVRLVRLALGESGLLTGLAALVAWGALSVAAPVVVGIIPPEFRGFAVQATDPRVVVAAIGAAFVGATMAGLVPAWHATTRRWHATLRAGRSRAGRSGSSLIAAQAAFGAALSVAAALSLQSFSRFAYSDPGFDAERLYQVSTGIAATHRDAADDPRAPAMLEALRGTPGVEVAGASTGMPVVGGVGGTRFWRNRSEDGWEAGVTEGFLEAFGIRLVAGRFFVASDIEAHTAAVVSETAARTLWPSERPSGVVGRTFPYVNGAPLTVIGVVEDIVGYPGAMPEPILFVPFGMSGLTSYGRSIFGAVRVTAGAELDTELLRDRVRATFGPGDVHVRYVPDLSVPFLHRPRFQAALFVALASVAGLLAVIGLFATISFEVTRRRFETAVRISLGASHRRIRRHVIGAALRPVLVGLLAGLTAMWLASTFLQSLLPLIDARNPLVYALVSAALVVAALTAVVGPARRAARVDPVKALRAE